MSTHRLCFLLLLSSLTACSSEEEEGSVDELEEVPPKPTLKPELRASVSGDTLAACPVEAGAGAPEDTEWAQARVALFNSGLAEARPTFRLEGPGKDAFRLAEAGLPTSLAPGNRVEVLVSFAPSAAGRSEASLVIDDGSAETPEVVVPLVGSGLALAAEPTLEVRVQGDGPEALTTCDGFGLCRLAFPSTFFGLSQTRTIEVANTGCPALQITGVELTKGAAGGDNLAYFIDEPQILPTSVSPLAVSHSTRGTSLFHIRFQPEGDASGSGLREGILRFSTNDPARPVFTVSLVGEGSAPASYAVPERCNFSDDSDFCGLEKKVSNQGRFRIYNAGTVDAVVTAELETGGQERFSLSTAAQNLPLPANGFVDVGVTHIDPPGAAFASERLVIRATVDGEPAGESFVQLGGGKAPRLTTTPGLELDFSAGTSASSTVVRDVTISNALGAGVLVVRKVDIEPNPYFKIIEAPPPGRLVQPGNSVSARLQYTKPPSGGVQAAVLRIETNDPAYGAPSYKVITLYSASPLDQVPVAVASVRALGATNWSAGPFTQSLLTLTGPSKTLELTCDASYDPQPATAPRKVKRCEYRLVKKPVTATQTSLDYDGEKIEAYQAGVPFLVKLQLTPNVIGTYQVDVYAYDDVGQRSNQPYRLTIYVTQ